MNAHDTGTAESGQAGVASRSAAAATPVGRTPLHWEIEAQRVRARALRARARVTRARAVAINARASGLLARAIAFYLSSPPIAVAPDARTDRAGSRTTRVVRTPTAAGAGARARALPPDDDAPETRRWSGCPVLAERIVFDSRDERWVVREVDARTVPGTLGERCLILENHERVRRLWDYPAGWARLSDESLLAMGQTGV